MGRLRTPICDRFHIGGIREIRPAPELLHTSQAAAILDRGVVPARPG